MSPRLIAYLLLPAAGFMLGWGAREASAPAAGPGPGRGPAAEHRRTEPAAAGALSGKRTATREVPGLDEEDLRRQAADRARLQDRCRRALESRLAEWTVALSLDPDQVAALRASLGELVGSADPPVAEAVMPRFREALESLLTSGQKEQAAALEARREEGRAAARAGARLAEVESVLLLDPGQRESIYQVLVGEAPRLPDPAAPAGPGLGPAMLAEITRRLADTGDDGSGFQTVAGEVVRDSIDGELGRLAPILRPDQLQAYRLHLEEKHASWLIGEP